MAFQRDIGIKFPSDTSQGGVTSFSMTGRTVKRFIARGSRYSKPLHSRSAWAAAVGDNWFRNSLSLSDLSTPEPVNYARFVDIRKTKIVDSIKESLIGGEHRAGIDTDLIIDKAPGFAKADSQGRKIFPAKIIPPIEQFNIGSPPEAAFAHNWVEVAWDSSIGAYNQLKNGRNPAGDLTQYGAIHRPSSGRLALPFNSIVTMYIEKTPNSKWHVSFDTDFSGVLLGIITDRSGSIGGDITYDARSVAFPTLIIEDTIPVNRGIQDARYFAALIDDPCLIVVPSEITLDPFLVLITELADSVFCDSQNQPPGTLGAGFSRRPGFERFVQPIPDAVNAIGQAL